MRKRSLFCATPMFGGMCYGGYSSSMMSLAVECSRAGIDMQYYTLHNESLIPRGRNYCADEFMRSGKTHMLFIDGDIIFNPKDVFTMLALADHLDEKNEYDVIGACYPKKSISWEKILDAVNKGYADKDPGNLDRFVGDFVFNPKAGTNSINLGEPCEIRELGTGFMLIKRKTFEVMQEQMPELLYKPDHARTAFFDGSREIMRFFDCIVDPESKRYLSEDYMFCYNVQKLKMGERMGKVWMCPWMELKHIGTFVFGGSILDMAQLGASLTVDPTKIVKK